MDQISARTPTILRVIGGVLLVVLIVLVQSWIVAALWNFVMPALYTNIRPIDLGRALGLVLLTNVILGGVWGSGALLGAMNTASI